MSLTRVLIAAVVLRCASGFYIPGMAPVEYEQGQAVDVKAVKMTSSKTLLPYEYFAAPFCMPKSGKLQYKNENLGEVLRGDRIVNTPYIVRVAMNQTCRILCQQTLDSPVSEGLSRLIQHEYYVHLLLDNLPVALRFTLGKSTGADDSDNVQYERGYHLGFVKDGISYLNNHLSFIVRYNYDERERYRIVGFEVEARSVAYGQLVGNAPAKDAKENSGKSFSQSPCERNDDLIVCPFFQPTAAKVARNATPQRPKSARSARLTRQIPNSRNWWTVTSNVQWQPTQVKTVLA